jgi:hypothetical protein
MSLRGVVLFCVGSSILLQSSCVWGNNLLSPGIIKDDVDLKWNMMEYIGYPHSAFNGTEVEIRFNCQDKIDYEYTAQFVIRSSSCDKEFFDARRKDTVQNLLEFYFNKKEIPAEYHYDEFVYYKSPVQTFNCKNHMEVGVGQTDLCSPSLKTVRLEIDNNFC